MLFQSLRFQSGCGGKKPQEIRVWLIADEAGVRTYPKVGQWTNSRKKAPPWPKRSEFNAPEIRGEISDPPVYWSPPNANTEDWAHGSRFAP